jgi:phosphatidylglycerophosphate synthase
MHRRQPEVNMFALTADLLTLSRVLAAGVLVWLGLTGGASALPAAVAVTMLGWTTDQLDGWFARRSPTPTRLKDCDFQVDLIYYAGVLVYLAAAAFLPIWLVAGFVILSLVAWLLTRRKAVVILFLRLIDLACGIVIFIYLPAAGFVLLAWLTLLAVLYRRRLVERVPRWWGDLRDLWRGRAG